VADLAAPGEPIERVPFLGLPLARLTPPELLRHIRQAADQRRCITVTYVHFHTINLIERSPAAAEALRRIDVLAPDGIAILWPTRLLGEALERRNILVMEYSMEVLAPEAVRQGWSLFLFGGDPTVAARAASQLTSLYPGLRIAGTHEGRVGTSGERQAAASLVAAAQPTIVLVGLGQPTQEAWVAEFRDRLGASAIICVGGYLEKLARRATIYPPWVNRTRLYWLHRMLTEPGLWRRYTIGGLRYAVTLVKHASRRRRVPAP